MINKALLQLIFTVFCLASGAAWAVEPPQPVIPLFDEFLIPNRAGIDISTNVGIETLGANNRVMVRNDRSDPTKDISRMRVRLQVNDSSDNAVVGTFTPFVDTRSYPDPNTGLGTSTTYWCLEYGAWRTANPSGEDFPCEYDGNIGIANAGATRYLVTSLAVYVFYANDLDGLVDVSKVTIHTWNPATGERLWRKNWNVTSGVWGLAFARSAVGDFLDADSVDEIRIAYERELPNGNVQMRYLYYNIADGTKIKEDKFVVPKA